MENQTPYEDENLPSHDDNADRQREWTTPELVVETVASVTELGGSNFSLDGTSGS
jgi:hypothetical protein